MKAWLLKYGNYITFFILLILLISIKISNPSFVKSISFISFDLYQKIFPLEKNETEVVIIDIDEKSLGKFGQFPWSRSVFAKILENVNAVNPKAIGFDVFFTEKDKQSPEEFLKAYNLIPTDVGEIQNLKGHDQIFKEQLEKSKSVTAVLGSTVPSHSNYDRKSKARFLAKGGDPKKFTYSYPYSIGSLEMLEKANELKSNDPYIIDSLGWALFKLKRFKESKKYLQLALRLMPADPIVNDHYGDVLWKNGNKLQARYYWKNVLQLENTEKDLKDKVKEKLVKGL